MLKVIHGCSSSGKRSNRAGEDKGQAAGDEGNGVANWFRRGRQRTANWDEADANSIEWHVLIEELISGRSEARHDKAAMNKGTGKRWRGELGKQDSIVALQILRLVLPLPAPLHSRITRLLPTYLTVISEQPSLSEYIQAHIISHH